MTRLLIVGHGRMGRLVESLAAAHGCEVTGILARGHTLADIAAPFDVAIDFSTADAVPGTLRALAAAGAPVVIGVTGWHAYEAEARAVAETAGIGVLASANFALGLHVFQAAVEAAARRFAAQPAYGAWIHESHHAAKKDAPSGTARQLQQAVVDAGFTRAIDVTSTRVGAIPGTHTVGFDGPADTVTLTHTVRDRAVFAHGAIEAAKWLRGRRGWFSMQDMLNT